MCCSQKLKPNSPNLRWPLHIYQACLALLQETQPCRACLLRAVWNLTKETLGLCLVDQCSVLSEPIFLAHTATASRWSHLRMIIVPSCISGRVCSFFPPWRIFHNDYLSYSSQDFFIMKCICIFYLPIILFTAKTIAGRANIHMDGLQIHSTLDYKLAFSCFPILFLNCEFYRLGCILSHVSVILKVKPLFFLFSTCPPHLLSPKLRVLAPKARCSNTFRDSRFWLLFTSFLSAAGAVYFALKLPITFN